MSQNHKVAIVTGGAGGIGHALVTSFAESGYRVLSVDSRTGFDHPNVTNYETDLAKLEELDKIIDYCLNQFNTIDVLINNAAVSLGKDALETDHTTWHTTMNVNVTAPFFLSQKTAKVLIDQKKAGAIVNMASVNSFAAERAHAAYVTSKGAIAAMTKSLAVDLAPFGIRVNAIAPGPIETTKTAEIFAQPDYVQAIKKGIPLSRAGSPLEVAKLALFLSSADASYITGQVIKIDGGYLSYARLD